MKSLLLHRNLVILKPFDFPTSTPLLQTRKLAVSDNLVLSGKVFTSSAKISALNASTQESSLHVHDESPVSIELQSIGSGDDFDKVIADEPVIIVWMATWCRKCIYLKPKLERLAADYYPRLPFYCVDVNMVSHKLVARAGVTKMPTIQLWKNGEKRDEVIGAYKAYLVASEVQKMIESEFSCE